MRKILVGIAVGALVAVLAPSMQAVATHSGSSPADHISDAHVRRGAYADWILYTPAGKDVYKIFVWQNFFVESDAGNGGAGSTQGLEGGAAAVVQHCDAVSYYRYECDPEEVARGNASGVAPAGADGVFTQDPTLATSQFAGTLHRSDGSSCHADLTWIAAEEGAGDKAVFAGHIQITRNVAATKTLVTQTCFTVPSGALENAHMWNSVEHDVRI